MLDLARSGYFEPFLHAFVRLLLGHDSPSILSEVYEVELDLRRCVSNLCVSNQQTAPSLIPRGGGSEAGHYSRTCR
ncbi:MAG: hypothetical protein JWM11_7513 [Planctomycetaceae bacterium]|nr:hypothetical protein [Planctomycetaceae bacterium]